MHFKIIDSKILHYHFQNYHVKIIIQKYHITISKILVIHGNPKKRKFYERVWCYITFG